MPIALTAADRATRTYDLLFRRSPRPSYVFDRSSFAFLDVNDAALELYGYDREEFLGMTALDIRPPEEVPRLITALREGTVGDEVWRHRTRDGGGLIVEVTHQRITWDGRAAQSVSVLDVTAREQAVRALADSEARFRLIFDASPIGIVTAGQDFRFLDANRAFRLLVGYELEELTSMTFLDLTHPDDRETDAHLATQLLAGTIPHYAIEKRYITARGDTIWIHLTAYTTRDARGDVRHAMGLVEDITERKQAEVQLREEATVALERLSTLTRREREILEASRSRTAQQVATELTISRRTAESHLASAYRKLSVNGREAAIRELDRLIAAIGRTGAEVRTEVPYGT